MMAYLHIRQGEHRKALAILDSVPMEKLPADLQLSYHLITGCAQIMSGAGRAAFASVEAAQALARRVLKEGGSTAADRVRHGFRLTLVRPPQPLEVQRLMQLLEEARQDYASRAKEAEALATDPLGPLPAGTDAVEAAAYTVVANVLLNLDETFVKR